MKIVMAAIEHSFAAIGVREIFSFTNSTILRLDREIADLENVQGCVLVSTCNRTELYICANSDVNPAEILCMVSGANYEEFKKSFDIYENNKAVHHLMEVSAGLRSRVFGEDQIISQIKHSISLARQAKAAGPVLETLFRTAVTAGKEIRSKVRLTSASASTAEDAIRIIEDRAGELLGKSALVIGNGEIGRTAAKLLLQKGCDVTITLRTYRHGETIVPAGCKVISYEDRYENISFKDFIISATASPHYTLTAEKISKVTNPPKFMVDLAVPRDIEPEIGDSIKVYNIDEIESKNEKKIPNEVYEIIAKQEQVFYRWLNYRDSMPALDELKEILLRRVMTDRLLEEPLDTAEIVELTVDKVVDLIMRGIEPSISSEQIQKCSVKINANTTAKPVSLREECRVCRMRKD